MMLTWPVLLIISFQVIKWVIKRYEKKQAAKEKAAE